MRSAGTGASRGVGESLVLKRRQREDALSHYADTVKGLTKMHARADWEHGIDLKSETTNLHRTVSRIKNQQESQLHSRRQRLAELYNREMEEWKQACLANMETPEDRKQKMIQRALELKERRERDRMAIVEEKLLQQYRESCDDLRVEDSRKLTKLVVRDRESQLEERKRIEEEEKLIEVRMAQLWEEDRLKKEERERRDREMAIKRDAEVKAILDLQVDLFKKRRTEEEQYKKQEDHELLAEWERLKQVEQALEEQRRQNEIQRAMDVKRFNQERVEQNRLMSAREREYDARLLELAMAQEAEAKRCERELQEKHKQAQLEFQAMLKKQMEVEAEDLSFLDKIRHEMEQQVWSKRDAQHAAEEAARQELLRQVIESREKQLEMKCQRKQQVKQEELVYMEQVKHDTEEALQKELREQEERRNELKRNQSELLKLQEARRIAEEQKKQAEYLELKRMQLVEKKHKERVAQFSTTAPSTNHRRKTAQWYFDA